MEVAIAVLVIAVLSSVKTVKVVPQQQAWVVERLGKFQGFCFLTADDHRDISVYRDFFFLNRINAPDTSIFFRNT